MIFESLWLNLEPLCLKTKIFLGDLGKIANGYGVCLDFLQGSSEIDSVESVLLEGKTASPKLNFVNVRQAVKEVPLETLETVTSEIKLQLRVLKQILIGKMF